MFVCAAADEDEFSRALTRDLDRGSAQVQEGTCQDFSRTRASAQRSRAVCGRHDNSSAANDARGEFAWRITEVEINASRQGRNNANTIAFSGEKHIWALFE